MTPLQYLGVAYALIWIGLGVYLFQLNRRIGTVSREIDELKNRLRGSGRNETD